MCMLDKSREGVEFSIGFRKYMYFLSLTVTLHLCFLFISKQVFLIFLFILDQIFLLSGQYWSVAFGATWIGIPRLDFEFENNYLP